MSDATPHPPLPAWPRALRALEHGLLGAILAALVLVPLLEILLRRTAGIGIQGSQAFVQHFTLLVSILGGALAAREGRLLTLSTLPTLFPPAGRRLAELFSNSVAAAVSAVLAVAAWQFVQTEPAQAILAYGIPKRAFQWFLPAAFAVVGLRLWWRSAPDTRGRLLGLVLIAILVAGARFLPAERLLWPGLALVVLATVLGGPLFVALGGVALLLLHGSGRPAALVPSEHYFLVTDAILPSLPLFTLAGYFLAEGGASRRLVRLFEAWVGGLRGGPAIITVLVCAFFTSFTGASGVTILALGPLLLPVLLRAGYPERASLGLVTGAGSLGLLFPPCLPLILYAVIAQRALQDAELPPGMPAPDASINALFLGGLGPGLLLLGLSAWYAIRVAPRGDRARPPFDGAAALRALGEAKWELLLPVLTLGVLLTGLATPVEAAAVAALWAFVTQVFVHRDLHWRRDVPRVLAECGLIIGGVLLILGVAMGLTKYLIFADVPTAGVEWIRQTIESKWLFLLLLNLFLLVVGCLMDIYSAIVVVVPLIVPMGLAFGVDPVHLGIIFLANLQLGFLTPPVGMNLFLASYRFQRPMAEVTRAVLPMMAVLLAGVILITYVPALTTTLPKLLRKSPPAAPASPAGGG